MARFVSGGYRAHKKYQLLVERFQGVNAADSAFSVDNNLGVDANNYMALGGCVQKRWGRKPVAYLAKPIMGLWLFKGTIIAALSDGIYKLNPDFSIMGERLVSASITETPTAIENPQGLWILAGGGYYHLYEEDEGIEANDLSDGGGYIPTTTITLLPVDADLSGIEGTAVSSASYESPNLLSRFRKNTFVGSTPRTGSGTLKYKLDAPFSTYTDYDYNICGLDIEFDQSLAINPNPIEAPSSVSNPLTPRSGTQGVKVSFKGYKSVTLTYRNGAPIRNENLFPKELTILVSWLDDTDRVIGTQEYTRNEWIANSKVAGAGFSSPTSITTSTATFFIDRTKLPEGYKDINVTTATAIVEFASSTKKINAKPYLTQSSLLAGDIEVMPSGKKLIFAQYGFSMTGNHSITDCGYGLEVLDSAGKKLYGYIMEGGDELVLFREYPYGSAAYSNGCVTFSHYESPWASSVTAKRKAIRFGHGNSLNRLWVYGGGSEPETAYYSQTGDFTYFPVDGFVKFGSGDILSMGIASATELIVYKEKNGTGPSIYFVSPTTYDGAEAYSVVPSNSPTAIGASGSSANFYGDEIFISQEGSVYGIDITGAIGNTKRQATTRSRLVQPLMEATSHSSARLFPFGKHCIYNAVEKAFITEYDARGGTSQTASCRWWPIDPIQGLSCVLEMNGKTIFGTSNGYIVEMTEERADAETLFASSSTGDVALAIGGEGSYIEVSDAWKAKFVLGGWKFKAKGELAEKIGIATEGGGYASKGYLIDYDGSLYAYKGFPDITDGDEFYFAGEEGFALRFTEDCDYLPDGTFPKRYIPNKTITGLTGDLALYRKVTGECSVFPADEGITLEFNGKALKEYAVITDQGIVLEQGSIECRFDKKSPIKAYFVTKPLLWETLNYDKTIIQAELWNDTKQPSELLVKMVGNKRWSKEADKTAFGAISQIDFASMDFEATGFDKKEVPTHYSLKRFPKTQAYYTISLKSDGLCNSVLSGVKLTYEMRGLSKSRG